MKLRLVILSFAVRHFLIVALAIAAGCVLWTLAYFLLIAIAVIGNQGMGGPLAYPAGVFAIFAACSLLGWGVFAPASGIGAILCRRFRLPPLAAIPVVFLGACLIFCLLYRLCAADSPPPVSVMLKRFAICLSLPLGIYWWLTEGPGALLDTFKRRNRPHASGAGTPPAISRFDPKPLP